MKKRLLEAGISAVLAAGLAVILDVISVWNGRALSVPKFAAMLWVLFLAIWLIPAVKPKMRRVGAAVLGMLCGVLLAAVLCWAGVSEDAAYRTPDQGKTLLYGGKKVMLLVPHQDDDINVLGGVIEEYRKYGSEVYVVFSTNGDYYGLAETRFREALTAADMMGVAGDHVIFLGYGDQWAPEGPHIYNGAPGETVYSYLGKTETYGTNVSAAYREGRSYTADHFLEDIESVILEHRPDILYCVDHDYNIDHRALSLAFEKVMGRILQKQEEYRPLVLKGYAYDTAWEADRDFYAENILSTRNALQPPFSEKPAVYRWGERVRLPVHGEGLSRSVLSAGQQKILSAYQSQGANMYGVRVINGDKVFWQRRTDSLCYQAELTVSSGNGALLQDFMLLEDWDLLDDNRISADGAWVPADDEKQVRVVFDQPRDLMEIWLYDHPDQSCNVLDARISFEDGTVLETGPLDPGGAATRFAVDKQGVSSFTVTLTRWEGKAGLTELEAYDRLPQLQPYVKLMDEAENFAYDYWIEADGQQSFALYTSGAMPAGAENYVLRCDNPRCNAVWEGDRVRITCPRGETAVVTVTSADRQLADSILVQNPGTLQRRYARFWLRAEETVMRLCDEKRLHERLFVCRLWEKVPGILDRIRG